MRGRGLVAAGGALVLIWGSLAQVGDLRHGGLPAAGVLYFAAALTYLLSLVLVRIGKQNTDGRAYLNHA